MNKYQTPMVGLAVLCAALLALSACSGTQEAALTGYEREPEPTVGLITLPAANRDTDAFAFQADPGELLMVSFGYSSCPDVCPTTLLDAKVALAELGSRAEDVDYAFVSIDPERDSAEVLTNYVEAFLDNGIALRTDDNEDLLIAADAFGVFYQVGEDDNGDLEVAHTAHIFLVDDTGSIVLTWPFGTISEDIASDLNVFLDRLEKL